MHPLARDLFRHFCPVCTLRREHVCVKVEDSKLKDESGVDHVYIVRLDARGETSEDAGRADRCEDGDELKVEKMLTTGWCGWCGVVWCGLIWHG